MKTINLRNQTNCKVFTYPDSQPDVIIDTEIIKRGDTVRIICSISNANDLISLLATVNACDYNHSSVKEIHITYLLAARSDIIIRSGQSLALEVIGRAINTEVQKFKANIYLYDVHSDVASDKIHDSINVPSIDLIEQYTIPKSVLICPDQGAKRRVADYLKYNSNLSEVVYCDKSRDKDGKVTLTVLDPDKCKDRNCVIIDDICDSGASFLAIADQIQAKHLTLMVTHGIFSKGLNIFQGKFDSIICTDSYSILTPHPLLTQIPIKIYD